VLHISSPAPSDLCFSRSATSSPSAPRVRVLRAVQVATDGINEARSDFECSA